MTLYPPLYMQNDQYAAQLMRQFVDASFESAGVGSSTDLAVTQRAAGANMSVDAAPGRCVVAGTNASGQGKYLCWSDAVTNVPLATAPGSGQERYDLIVAQVRDANVIGGPNNDWIIIPVQGTAAPVGSAVIPAAPLSSLALRFVHVGPLVTQILNADIGPAPGLWHQSLRTPEVLGRGSAIVGTPPAVGSGMFYEQFGLATVNTDSAGNARVTFPTPFPNGVIFVSAQPYWATTVNNWNWNVGAGLGLVDVSGFTATLWSESGNTALASVAGAKMMWLAKGF